MAEPENGRGFVTTTPNDDPPPCTNPAAASRWQAGPLGRPMLPGGANAGLVPGIQVVRWTLPPAALNMKGARIPWTSSTA